jgi:hypothetical protein
MIHGWFMEVPSLHGRDGTRIREFGMTAHTFRSELDSESDSSEDMAGAGVIGDLIGTTDTRFITTTGTTREAARFTTETTIIEAEANATDSTAIVAEIVPAPMLGTGLPASVVERPTVPAPSPGHSTATARRREDTRNPAVRAGPARAPSAATTMADRREAFLHAEAPAWVAEGLVAQEEGVAAVAGIEHQFPVRFLVVGKTQSWGEVLCGKKSGKTTDSIGALS